MKYKAKVYGRVSHNGLPVVLVMPLGRRVKAVDPKTKGPYMTLARYLRRDQFVWSDNVHGWVCVHDVQTQS